MMLVAVATTLIQVATHEEDAFGNL